MHRASRLTRRTCPALAPDPARCSPLKTE